MIEFEKLYTTKEIAEMLNMNQQTIMRKVRGGDISGMKLGNTTWRVKGKDLNDYLGQKSTVETENGLETGINNDLQ